MTPEEQFDYVSSAGLLTERQAQAYLLREVQTVPRTQAADYMGVSVNVLDKHLRAARDKVESARDTLERLEEIDDEMHPPAPDDCADCGATLAGPISRDDDGRYICLDCAGIDPDDLEQPTEAGR